MTSAISFKIEEQPINKIIENINKKIAEIKMARDISVKAYAKAILEGTKNIDYLKDQLIFSEIQIKALNEIITLLQNSINQERN